MTYPLLFQPNLHTVVWGGHKIQPYKGITATDEPIGESWEVSAVPSSQSIVANGELAGKPLGDVVALWGERLLGNAVAQRYGGEFPLLMKIIDAAGDLSIQVHPNDTLARERHGKNGKTECWYIISAEPGAALYAGFKSNITPEEYRQRVADGTITEVLARHEVSPGDVFYLPAGRIHAIGKGIMLAEVQQSSDVTYRIFDYNRPGLDGKPRELHTDLAADAIDYTVEAEYRTPYINDEGKANSCISSPFFSMRIVETREPFHRNLIKYDSFVITTCISGECELRFRQTGDVIPISQGTSCLIPADIADYDIIPTSTAHRVRMLDSYIDNKNRSLTNKVTRFLHITKK